MSKQSLITPVILCGGSGTRLWPLSRRTSPKQFIKIRDDDSLFQQTLKRVGANANYGPPVILTNADYRFQVAEQALEIGVALGAIVLEPSARNTAPAIAAAVTLIAKENAETLIHIFASDHYIDDNETYRNACLTAAEVATDDKLVVFGIEPTSPATGYGYIKASEKLSENAAKVAAFTEKPDLQKAQGFLAEGGYSWNSGMFLFKADTFIKELEKFEPKIVECVKRAVDEAVSDLDFVRLDAEEFDESPNISVDYAVFERTDRAAVVFSAINWSDIGSWQSLWASREGDDSGNVLASGDATFHASENNLVIADGQHVALNGVDNIAIVATDDAILVSALDRSEDVKEIVSSLKKDEANTVLTEEHKTIYRPWGGYTSILESDRFKVKKLFVKPGKRLSLQKHHHRSEHWVVVCGTAEVVVDEKTSILSENESVYIPLGAVHRLSNPGHIQLEVIEVQSGSYLGEDDIIRFEDDFGRGRDY